MVEALEKDLQKNGVGKDQLVGDFFPGYPISDTPHQPAP